VLGPGPPRAGLAGAFARALAALALVACVSGGVVACGGGGPEEPREYVVKRGDTLYSIARRFGVSPDELARVNGIEDPTQLPLGRHLLVPGRNRRARIVESTSGRSCFVDADAQRAARRRAETELDLAFDWPLSGPITSCFGQRNSRPHEGIDVSVPGGTPVYAAESGKVIYSGRLGGYGELVVLKHAGPYSSIYAHLSDREVDVGEFVEKGSDIGESGSTGNATGPHLHFEIRRAQRPTDPLLYLP